jgi:hypothetical protein
MENRRRSAWLVVLVTLPMFGFDTTRHAIPLDEIRSGGPPKDGIPALDEPRFVLAEAAQLRPDDRVVGIAHDGVAKAYPLGILSWHEAVNDKLGDLPVVVTYCPLTASAIVFDRRVGGRARSFGISGRLYQSNVLLYDREREGLWSQLAEEAVTGQDSGTRLRVLPAVETSWADWRREHPDTLVLSFDTGHDRNYKRDPYAAYHGSPHLMFPVARIDDRLPAKERVLGLRLESEAKAYPLAALAQESPLDDTLGAARVRVLYDARTDRAEVRAAETGELLPGVVVYWFAWAAFHPDTALWRQRRLPAGAAVSIPAQPHGSAAGGEWISIVDHRAYWTDLFGLGDTGLGPADSGDQPGLFVISGTLRNESPVRLRAVELSFELLDGAGRVVTAERGYNRGAEVLRPLDSPFPVEANDPPVVPIAAGATDSFRMIFLRDELPAFASYRVSVRDTRPLR